MIDTYCAKAAECSSTTDRTEQASDCEFALHVQLDCGNVLEARSVSGCLRAIDDVDCRSVGAGESPPFPDACMGVLGTN
ncbi:MAG TPA: hypothetical protein VH062_11970 [Polyangiaceae bacterium]|nr:hypothetical protein [Polyangiaceae bacterium]